VGPFRTEKGGGQKTCKKPCKGQDTLPPGHSRLKVKKRERKNHFALEQEKKKKLLNEKGRPEKGEKKGEWGLNLRSKFGEKKWAILEKHIK